MCLAETLDAPGAGGVLFDPAPKGESPRGVLVSMSVIVDTDALLEASCCCALCVGAVVVVVVADGVIVAEVDGARAPALFVFTPAPCLRASSTPTTDDIMCGVVAFAHCAPISLHPCACPPSSFSSSEYASPPTSVISTPPGAAIVTATLTSTASFPLSFFFFPLPFSKHTHSSPAIYLTHTTSTSRQPPSTPSLSLSLEITLSVSTIPNAPHRRAATRLVTLSQLFLPPPKKTTKALPVFFLLSRYHVSHSFTTHFALSLSLSLPLSLRFNTTHSVSLTQRSPPLFSLSLLCTPPTVCPSPSTLFSDCFLSYAKSSNRERTYSKSSNTEREEEIIAGFQAESMSVM